MARPFACYLVGAALLGFLALSLAFVVSIHLHEVAILERSELLRTSGMCAAFGMLGSAVAAIRKYYRVLITETTAVRDTGQNKGIIWDFGWVFYYLTRPILGSVLGALSFILVFILFEILSSAQASAKISRHGHMMLYAIALMAGYSVSQVLDRLSVVSKQVFAPIRERKGQ